MILAWTFLSAQGSALKQSIGRLPPREHTEVAKVRLDRDVNWF